MKEKETLQKCEYRNKLDECSKEKVREYDRNRKNNNNKNEAEHDINCDVKSNSNGKSKSDGKCDVKHDIKHNVKCEQDNKSSWRCRECREKLEKNRQQEN